MSFEPESARLLDLLYAAPGDNLAWARFLDEFARFIDANMVSFVLFDEANHKYSVSCTSGFPPEALRLYQEHYASLDEWYLRAKGRVSAGYADNGQVLCPVNELRRTEFYNDFLRPNGWLHECAAVLELRPSAIATMALLRTSKQADFSNREIGILRAFVPHIKRALQLHRRFVDVKTRADSEAWALNQVPFGVVLLRQNGTIIAANSAAEKICNGDGLSLRGNTIHACGLQNHQFQEFVKRAWRSTLWPPSPASVAITRSNGVPILVTIGCVPPGCESFERSAAVFIQDPLHQPICSEDVLRTLYALTGAECRLTLLLAEGLGIPDAAEQLGIAPATARAQLKSVFQKTSTKRQSQLARLVMSLSRVA